MDYGMDQQYGDNKGTCAIDVPHSVCPQKKKKRLGEEKVRELGEVTQFCDIFIYYCPFQASLKSNCQQSQLEMKDRLPFYLQHSPVGARFTSTVSAAWAEKITDALMIKVKPRFVNSWCSVCCWFYTCVFTRVFWSDIIK